MARCIHMSHDVYRPLLFPHFVGSVDATAMENSSVAAEQVDMTESLFSKLDEAFDILFLAHVTDASDAAYVLSKCDELCLIHIGDHDVGCTFLLEAFYQPATDAA